MMKRCSAKQDFRNVLLFALIMMLFVSAAQIGWVDSRTILGVERLIEEKLDLIEGKRIGIIANHTSVDFQGKSIAALLSAKTKVTALFGPEHGFEGNQSAGAVIEKSLFQGIPIYSLYGEYRTPTPMMLENVDVLIYDMQDVGARFYTYISSLFLALSAAKQYGIPLIVLDRPNPITAQYVQGPILNPAYASYVGVMPLPIRYGMTVGELARLMNGESYAGFSLQAELVVIPMKHYSRSQWYDETGLPWIAPSPNMPTLETAAVYPGMCLFEGTNLSEGRGTPTPFQTIGAPFIDAERWLQAMPADVQKGVHLKPVAFTPVSIPGKSENPKYKNQKCFGLQVNVTDRDVMKPIDLSVALLCAARSLYPEQMKINRGIDRLWGGESLRARINAGVDYDDILVATQEGLDRFQSVRARYLLYP
ncbi:MAG: exo-beta-N-acetylmuramidase NamZ family protein [Candidatus Hinthialibacter sp.]